MDKLKELSLFFPAYNEEGNIKNTVEKAIPVLKNVASKYELLIVDDGSKDKTGEIIVVTKKTLPGLKSTLRVKGKIDAVFTIGDLKLLVFSEDSFEEKGRNK